MSVPTNVMQLAFDSFPSTIHEKLAFDAILGTVTRWTKNTYVLSAWQIDLFRTIYGIPSSARACSWHEGRLGPFTIRKTARFGCEAGS